MTLGPCLSRENIAIKLASPLNHLCPDVWNIKHLFKNIKNDKSRAKCFRDAYELEIPVFLCHGMANIATKFFFVLETQRHVTDVKQTHKTFLFLFHNHVFQSNSGLKSPRFGIEFQFGVSRNPPENKIFQTRKSMETESVTKSKPRKRVMLQRSSTFRRPVTAMIKYL